MEIRKSWFGALFALMLITAVGAAQQESSSAKPSTASKQTSSHQAGSSADHASTHSESPTSSHATKNASGAAHSSSAKSAAKTSSKTSTVSRSSAGRRPTTHKKRVRGQQKIDPERAQAIQQALIREHYLSPDAAGKWNQASEDAMRRYQEDHGWQTKEVPDSRALIKLGLGPSKDGLLNPESAMTTAPDAPKAESTPANSHSTGPAASVSSPNRE